MKSMLMMRYISGLVSTNS